jgi:hypothetical protein
MYVGAAAVCALWMSDGKQMHTLTFPFVCMTNGLGVSVCWNHKKNLSSHCIGFCGTSLFLFIYGSLEILLRMDFSCSTNLCNEIDLEMSSAKFIVV